MIRKLVKNRQIPEVNIPGYLDHIVKDLFYKHQVADAMKNRNKPDKIVE